MTLHADAQHVIEPIVQFIAAPYGGNDPDIPFEDSLVTGARMLSEDFDLPVDFVTGSLVPAGGEPIVDE